MEKLKKHRFNGKKHRFYGNKHRFYGNKHRFYGNKHMMLVICYRVTSWLSAICINVTSNTRFCIFPYTHMLYISYILYHTRCMYIQYIYNILLLCYYCVLIVDFEIVIALQKLVTNSNNIYLLPVKLKT